MSQFTFRISKGTGFPLARASHFLGHGPPTGWCLDSRRSAQPSAVEASASWRSSTCSCGWCSPDCCHDTSLLQGSLGRICGYHDIEESINKSAQCHPRLLYEIDFQYLKIFRILDYFHVLDCYLSLSFFSHSVSQPHQKREEFRRGEVEAVPDELEFGVTKEQTAGFLRPLWGNSNPERNDATPTDPLLSHGLQ